jgi:hypothetical protein
MRNGNFNEKIPLNDPEDGWHFKKHIVTSTLIYRTTKNAFHACTEHLYFFQYDIRYVFFVNCFAGLLTIE